MISNPIPEPDETCSVCGEGKYEEQMTTCGVCQACCDVGDCRGCDDETDWDEERGKYR